MHFISFITANVENINPPLMEGLDSLVAVSSLPCLPWYFMVETSNFIYAFSCFSFLRKPRL